MQFRTGVTKGAVIAVVVLTAALVGSACSSSSDGSSSTTTTKPKPKAVNSIVTESPEAAALALMPESVEAGLDIRVESRRYALCSATNTTPSDQTVVIDGATYTVATGTCPIIDGWTVYNESLQGPDVTVSGSATIWSSYGVPSEFPQFIDGSWSIAPDTLRLTTAGTPPSGGMANFFGYPCVEIPPVMIDGKEHPMAMCAGPLMEGVGNKAVAPGTAIRTHTPEGATFPVGGAEYEGSENMSGLLDILMGRVSG